MSSSIRIWRKPPWFDSQLVSPAYIHHVIEPPKEGILHILSSILHMCIANGKDASTFTYSNKANTKCQCLWICCDPYCQFVNP